MLCVSVRHPFTQYLRHLNLLPTFHYERLRWQKGWLFIVWSGISDASVLDQWMVSILQYILIVVHLKLPLFKAFLLFLAACLFDLSFTTLWMLRVWVSNLVVLAPLHCLHVRHVDGWQVLNYLLLFNVNEVILLLLDCHLHIHFRHRLLFGLGWWHSLSVFLLTDRRDGVKIEGLFESLLLLFFHGLWIVRERCDWGHCLLERLGGLLERLNVTIDNHCCLFQLSKVSVCATKVWCRHSLLWALVVMVPALEFLIALVGPIRFTWVRWMRVPGCCITCNSRPWCDELRLRWELLSGILGGLIVWNLQSSDQLLIFILRHRGIMWCEALLWYTHVSSIHLEIQYFVDWPQSLQKEDQLWGIRD